MSGSWGCSTGSGSRPTPNLPSTGGSGTTVLLRTCPLLDAARRHPEVVCQVHLGLVAGALEAHHEPSDGLRLVPFARPGACVLDAARHTGAMSVEQPRADCRDRSAGDVTVVVLAGGTSRRFGADKLGARLHGSTVLETVVGLATARAGPWSSSARSASAAGRSSGPARSRPAVGRSPGSLPACCACATRLVAVVAGDMPYAGPALEQLVAALRTAPPEVGGVVATDEGGFANPLLAAYRTASVRAALPIPAANRPAKLLLEVPHLEVAVTGPAGRDVDTPADLDDLETHPGPARPRLAQASRASTAR